MTAETPQAVTEREEAIAWLRGLGDKWLGDGVCQSWRASALLAALSAPPADSAMHANAARYLCLKSLAATHAWIAIPEEDEIDEAIAKESSHDR
jgi:hypothetical protein